MRRIDLVEFNKELLQKLNEAGIRLDDYLDIDRHWGILAYYDIGAGKPTVSTVG